MSTPALQTEHIARAIHAALVAQLPAALATVRQAWAAVEDVLLPDPVEITFGFRENVLDLFVTDFPRVAVLAAPRQPEQGQSSQLFAQATHAALIEWQVLGPDERHATVMGWRYGQAILDVLIHHEPYAGFDLVTITPAVDEGQAASLRANGEPNPELGLVAGGSTTLLLRGRYTR